MELKKNEKNESFYCEKCDFICVFNSDWDRHLTTRKHLSRCKMEMSGNILGEKNECKIQCDKCSKIYKTNAGLWKHSQKCNKKEQGKTEQGKTEQGNIEKMDIYNLVKYLMKENGDLKSMMMEQQNIVLEIAKNGTHNTTNTNSHNKTFNLQFFLNETCKDAMNIMDFVDSINLQLSDLEQVGKLGYVEGISKIITSNLNAMDVHKRPVHCADKKREVLYIKDDDKWEKEDDDKKKIRQAIKRVAAKNQRLIPNFKEAHPDCNKYHSKFSDQYNKIIVESMGGSGDNDLEKEDKIIKNISKNVIIDKSL